MKKLTVLIFLIGFQSFSQNFKEVNWNVDSDYTPFNPKATKNTYGIKAKLLPYFIGNSFGSYSSLGTEIGFLKNQSVTVEGFFNYEQSSHDEVVDRFGNQYDSGNCS